MKRTRQVGAVVTFTVTALALAACSSTGGAAKGGGSAAGEVTVWAHQGQEAEVQVLEEIIEDFNASQDEHTAVLQFVPEADYTSTVTTTAPGALPDVLEYDGPMMASLVHAGKLAPVGDLVAAQTLENQTASVLAQNTFPGDSEVYGISQFDASLGIYGNKELLDAAGVTYPEGIDDAWTAEEFTAALEALKAQDADGQVLDIKENYGAEWPTYGFLPVLWSAGARLVEDGVADGHLNSAAAVAAVEQFASWRPFIDPNTDDAAFVDERVALSWVGHWMYNTYAEGLGDKLVVLPLPDFGNGPKSGQGSWAWGVNPESGNPEGAAAFLDHLASDDAVTAMTTANAAPPATTSAVEASELYGAEGPLAIFAESLQRTCGDGQLTVECVAVPRPVTPAYPVISKQFSEAFFGAYEGGNAKELLDKAARAIDLDFQDNDGYGLD